MMTDYNFKEEQTLNLGMFDDIKHPELIHEEVDELDLLDEKDLTYKRIQSAADKRKKLAQEYQQQSSSTPHFTAEKPSQIICLLKRHPDEDVFSIIPHNELPDAVKKSEMHSPSTNNSVQDSNSELSEVSRLAIAMVEDNILRVNETSQLEEYEKLFISNLIFIKKQVTVDHKLGKEAFVNAVNSELSNAKEKRKDDQLRFIYKRAIKIMLCKSTGYVANKSHRMSDFEDDFIQYYFGKKDAKSNEVLDTSFASCKKLKQFFTLSEKFKKDFIETALVQISDEYVGYTADTYSKMNKFLKSAYDKKSANHKTLMLKFKRVPWSAKDINLSIDMVRNLVK